MQSFQGGGHVGCGGQPHRNVDDGHGEDTTHGGGADVLHRGGKIAQLFAKGKSGQFGVIFPVGGVTAQYDFMAGHFVLTSLSVILYP